MYVPTDAMYHVFIRHRPDAPRPNPIMYNFGLLVPLPTTRNNMHQALSQSLKYPSAFLKVYTKESKLPTSDQSPAIKECSVPLMPMRSAQSSYSKTQAPKLSPQQPESHPNPPIPSSSSSHYALAYVSTAPNSCSRSYYLVAVAPSCKVL
jgi:hypothetical protein